MPLTSSARDISAGLMDYLFDKVEGFPFERLIQTLLGIRDGEAFVPLGGVQDGGADGFFRSTFAHEGDTKHFVQMSVQADVPGKVRATVARLREVGRLPGMVSLWTTRLVSHLDQVEDELSRETGVTIRIRDRAACYRLVNANAQTREHFISAFYGEIAELQRMTGSAEQKNATPDLVSDPSVFAFLQLELGDRFGKGGIAVPIVDAMIMWSLRDTDPDQDQFLTRDEIAERIVTALPGATANLMPHLDERLRELTTKIGGNERRLREYRKAGRYCLPYAVRLEVATASAEEVRVRSQALASFRARAISAGAGDESATVIADVCEKAVYRHFIEQGLVLAAFLEKRLEHISISDQVVETELRHVVGSGEVDHKAYSIALTVLRQLFYTPNLEENEFLKKTSRTTMLLFSLKHCPRLIEYFNKMTGQFRLLVGTDLLVKAISEVFLPDQHRAVTNLLKVAKECGAQLVLTGPTAYEVFTHLHAAHLEFRNYYASREAYMTPSLASQSDRILIRTYFYAKLLMKRVAGWKSFINAFVDFDELEKKSDRGVDQLSAYLCKTHGLEFVSEKDISAGVDEAEVRALASELEKRDLSKNEMIAKQDALMVLGVYAQRRKHQEVAKYDGFGLRTWWLTKELRVLSYTGGIVAKNGGTPYIMRPEFLLNFLSLSPEAGQMDTTVRQLLPSHVGLQMGQHLRSEHMQKILEAVDEWKELPAPRVEIKISEAVDKLKFDRLKRYESNLSLGGEQEADVVVQALREKK